MWTSPTLTHHSSTHTYSLLPPPLRGSSPLTPFSRAPAVWGMKAMGTEGRRVGPTKAPWDWLQLLSTSLCPQASSLCPLASSPCPLASSLCPLASSLCPLACVNKSLSAAPASAPSYISCILWSTPWLSDSGSGALGLWHHA